MGVCFVLCCVYVRFDICCLVLVWGCLVRCWLGFVLLCVFCLDCVGLLAICAFALVFVGRFCGVWVWWLCDFAGCKLVCWLGYCLFALVCCLYVALFAWLRCWFDLVLSICLHVVLFFGIWLIGCVALSYCLLIGWVIVR